MTCPFHCHHTTIVDCPVHPTPNPTYQTGIPRQLSQSIMPNPGPALASEAPSVHNIWPLSEHLTEADIRFITSNLPNPARTEFINLAKLSQHASQTCNLSLAKAVERQIRIFFEREASRIYHTTSAPHPGQVQYGISSVQGIRDN